MKRALGILAVLGLAQGGAFAQQANVDLDWAPHRDAEGLVPMYAPLNSPEVHEDRTATFRVAAPSAREVALTGYALFAVLDVEAPLPMQRGQDGVWEVTVGPLPPDIYVYRILVDGAAVPDPSNSIAGVANQPPYSLLVVHGDGPAWYDAKRVPHGTVTRHVYHSDVTGGERELFVYAPPGYDAASRYPVLYLMGGSGETASNWFLEGRAGFILDNLLAEGAAEPMLIVVPNNQLLHRAHPDHRERTFDLVEAELTGEVLPLVESRYAARSDRQGRALAGLSMGGRHAMVIGFRNLDLFASLGILSAGDTEAEKSLAGVLADETLNERLDFLLVGQGSLEATPGNRTEALHEALARHGVEHEYVVSGNAHDWATWRRLLHAHLLPGLWRSPGAAGSPAGSGAHGPVVEDLVRLLAGSPETQRALEDAIRTADLQGIPDLDAFLSYVDGLVTYVPTAREVGPHALKLYYIVDQAAGDQLNRDERFSAWLHGVVEAWGAFLDSPASAAGLQSFVESPAFAIDDYVAGPSGWLTFNQFFAREIKRGRRPIAEPHDDGVVVSPADSVFAGHWPISEDSSVTVKGIEWTIAELLDGSPYANAFAGGVFTHSFLGVPDYHRYHLPVPGTVVEARNIHGRVYMDVVRRPDGSLGGVDGETYQVAQERGLVVVDSPELGLVAVLPVGMSFVSSVRLTAEVGDRLRKGDEFGFFQFGGSDMVMLFQKGKVALEIEPGVKYLQGRRIGRRAGR